MARSVVIRMLFNTSVILVTTERSEEVLFECIGYSIKVVTWPGPARPGPTENRSRFCEANIFFVINIYLKFNTTNRFIRCDFFIMHLFFEGVSVTAHT